MTGFLFLLGSAHDALEKQARRGGDGPASENRHATATGTVYTIITDAGMPERFTRIRTKKIPLPCDRGTGHRLCPIISSQERAAGDV